MGKYLVTSGSAFQPFTYDELVKPIAQAVEAHNAAQDAYDQLGLETNALRNYISDNPDDAKAKAMYDSYVDKLQSLQNNLWKNGYGAQTRRDLTSARAGYASDITRLSKAIKDRQDRSVAYWKTKHDHPDMIMGADPGLSGLDNYLANDQFGQNYYAYSGNQFTAEVSADAKARANEMLNDPEVRRNPELVGYLEVIQKNGFSSENVANAATAVRGLLNGDDTIAKQLDPASSILADVLMKHLESTGAAGNVSDSEFNRLFDYGVAGLSQSIGQTKVQELSDKQWDFNKQVALASMKARSSVKTSTNTPTGPTYGQHGYSIQDISSFLKSKQQETAGKTIKKYFDEPFKEPVVTSSGDVIANPIDAENILAGLGRQEIMSRFGGIDPLHPTVGKGTMLSGQNGTVEVRVVSNYINKFGDEVLEDNPYYYVVQTKGINGKWSSSRPLTEEFNEKYDAFKANEAAWKEANPGIELDKLAISKKERQKIAKDTGIPDEVPLEYVPSILATQSGVGRITAATIAGATKDMESSRDNYMDQIVSVYNRTAASQKKINKSDESAFYKVINGSVSKDGLPIGKVFKKGDTVKEIFVYPEDLKNNQVRIAVGNKDTIDSGTVYAINPAMLGNTMDTQIQKMRGYVSDAMLPITDPSKAVMLTPDEEARWIYNAERFIGDYMSFIGQDESGNVMMITPRDIVTNPELQEFLRTAVTRRMNDVIADARDNMNLDNMQVRGNTSTKAEDYNE